MNRFEGGITDLERLHSYLPNTQALHPATSVQVYREYKVDDKKVDITVLYREPGKEKMRIDIEVDYNVLDPAIELLPKDLKILKWDKAEGFSA